MENAAQPTNQQQPIQNPQLEQAPTPKSLAPEPLPASEEPFFKLPIFIIFALIILFFVFLWIYLSVGKKLLSFKPNIAPTPVVTLPQQTTKLGIATNWSTFVSSFNYLIKYPSNWNVYQSSWTEEPHNKQFSLENDDEAVLRFREPEQASKTAKLTGLVIRLKKPAGNPDNLSIKEWLKKNYPALSLIKTEDIKVADIQSVKAASLLGGQVTYILIPYKEQVYQIVKQSFDDGSSYDYDQIFNQILTTVEFFNQPTP